jgi:hypothetical protein
MERMGKGQPNRVLRRVPLEYWETCDARQGGVIRDINEQSLSIHSPVDMRIEAEMNIRIFFCFGYDFDGFELLAKIVEKSLCCSEGWETYQYKLKIMQISGENYPKFREYLRIRHTDRIYS